MALEPIYDLWNSSSSNNEAIVTSWSSFKNYSGSYISGKFTALKMAANVKITNMTIIGYLALTIQPLYLSIQNKTILGVTTSGLILKLILELAFFSAKKDLFSPLGEGEHSIGASVAIIVSSYMSLGWGYFSSISTSIGDYLGETPVIPLLSADE